MTSRSFRIEHPDDEPMHHSESLLAFLTRSRSSQFRIGDWLESMPRDELHKLVDLGEHLLYDNTATRDSASVSSDFIQVCALAASAEYQRRVVRVDRDTMTALLIAATLVFLSKDGLIILKDRLSLDPEAALPRVIVTDRGMAAGFAFAQAAF